MPAPEDRSSALNRHTASMGQFYEPVREELQHVRELIAQQLQSPEETANACLQQLIRRQGKLLRPALTLLCGKLVSPLHSSHIQYAAMVELIHMASLLHDDVIDSSDLRRGEPSMNALWGNTAAVLLGDFLLAKAFSLVTDSDSPAAMDKLIQTAQALCEGELTQNLCRDRCEITESDYLKIIEKKTAALFSCSCGLGALASGASDEQMQMLERFGQNLGLAFQISDDLRDLLSQADTEGKPLRADILNGILTLPVIHWITRNPANRQRLLEYTDGSGAIDDFIELLESNGSIRYTVERTKACTKEAKDALKSFPGSHVKDALISITENIIYPGH